MSTTLTVDLGDRSYPIHIGTNLLTQPELLTKYIHGNTVLIVSNTTVAPLYLAQVKANLAAYRVETIVLPDGEQYKTLDVLNQVFDGLLGTKCSRQVTLIALGGGVVGDMTGFAAACYQRGVAFIQVPTTLLSQVDSSVGGKTAVNHPLGKNMIGAFYQPQCVIADTDTLNTLPDRELSSGLAEVIKYGLINDADFFVWLEENIDGLLAREPALLALAIARSCQDKADLVAQDEEEHGVRALLNLGHTFGHAIETEMGYGNWLHGEGVAAGMVMAADLSQRLGWLDASATARTKALLVKARLPIAPPTEMTAAQFMQRMAVDKKVQQGHIRFILMRGIGQAVISDDYDADKLAEMLAAYYPD